MKKTYMYCAFILLFSTSFSQALSQKLTVGILNGINFTKPQGNFTSGKWDLKNGPVSGIFINYQLLQTLSVQTEFDFTVVNYSHKSYKYPGYYYQEFSYSSYYIPYYRYADEKWEYSFYRIPLYLKLSTPTKLKLELAIGGYLSFRDTYETPNYPIYYDMLMTNSLRLPYNTNEIPPKHDAGFFYSVGLAYPITKNLNVHLEGRYFSGRRTYIESVSAKNRVAEMTFGLGYSGFLKSKNPKDFSGMVNDSSKQTISVKVKSGIAFSQNSAINNSNLYSGKTGFSSGLSFMYNFSEHLALQSELLYERMGYQIKGESNSFFKYTPGGYYTIDNKVNIDYVTLPLLLNVRFGTKFTIYFNAGIYAAMKVGARCTGIASNIYSGETGYLVYKTNVNDDIDGFIKDNDWGYTTGTGIQYPIFGKYKLDFEIRYNTGKSNIYSKNNNYYFIDNEDTELKNKSYSLNLGLQFPLN